MKRQMKQTAGMLFKAAVVAVVGAGCLAIDEKAMVGQSASFMTSANAIIGRPLTPMSYAGVARRTTARAYAAPVVVAPAPVVVAPAAAVVAPRCVQAVDPYGRIYTRCY